MKRLLIYTLLLAPLFLMIIRILILEDITEPVKYIYIVTGSSAIVILFITICISMMKNKINLMKFRKEIGLFGFFYAILHLVNFALFDASLDLLFILEETIDKPFIYLGMISFFILLFMSVTSTKTLFKKYKNYHKSIYLVLILTTIHWVMAQKSINITQFIYIGISIFIAYCKLVQQIVNNNKRVGG